MTSTDFDNKMSILVFVSTGDLQAMFTLRTCRMFNGFVIESYIKNLSTDFDKAESLAQEYAKNLQERIGGSTCEVIFTGMEIDEVFKRRGKLSVRDTRSIEMIEAGEVPFGKHHGKKIADLPDTYLLWLTDNLKKEDLGPAFFALCSVASGIAETKGLFAKREVIREEKLQEDLKSTHFGELKTRYEEDVDVLYKNVQDIEGWIQNKYTIKIGSQILTHNGKIELPLGKCRIKFTVKFHYEVGEHKIKKTYINRPVLIEGEI